MSLTIACATTGVIVKIIYKIVLVSFLVSLNVVIWKDILGEAFYEIGFIVSAFMMGIYLRNKAYASRRKP